MTGAAPEPTLRQRIVRGSFSIIAGQGAAQVVRLASNLILTRLLLREHFGLMLLVNVAIQGIEMFSDVGLRGSVVADKRGEDPVFLDTAWTVQIVRGFAIWLVASILAVPLAGFYDKPELAYLIPAVAFAAVISGFTSTARLTVVRRVVPGRRVVFDLLAQVASAGFMISMAFAWKSVWVLALGSLVAAFVKVALSFYLLPGTRNRIRFEREAFASIFRFGRWITVAVALTFAAQQMDRLVLGRLLTATDLGVFAIATVLTRTLIKVMGELSLNILHPTYAKLLRHRGPELRAKIFRLRAALLALAMPPLWFMMLFGPEIVGLLWDERYTEAGWMVQILAVASLVQVVAQTSERVVLATGDSFRWMCLQLCRVVAIAAGMWFGFQLDGLSGLLWGIVAARVVAHVPLALMLHHEKAWIPSLDFAAFASTAVVVLLGQYFRG